MSGGRLEIASVDYAFPGAEAATLRGVSLDIAAGERVALLGPSGCGKTTVLRLVAGLLTADKGTIRLDRVPLDGLPPERRDVVMVFQEPLLFPAMDVAGNVGFGLRMQRVGRAEIATRVAEMLEHVRLPGLGPRRVDDLSGGQRQRVALARALVTRPKVLLLDEPLSNLDAHLRDEMQALIDTLQRETGVTLVLVTHDREEAVSLADRIGLMRNGTLAQMGPPRAFYERPVDSGVARFFGGRNFVPGQVRDGVFACALGPLPVPSGTAEGPGLLTIRPEAVRVAPGPSALMTRLVSRRYLGSRVEMEVTRGGVTLHVSAPPEVGEGLRPGDGVPVSLPRGRVWVLPPENTV